MSEKTYTVTEDVLRAALADAEARMAAANDEIGRLDEEGRSDSGQMREAMMVEQYGRQHIAQLKELLNSMSPPTQLNQALEALETLSCLPPGKRVTLQEP